MELCRGFEYFRTQYFPVSCTADTSHSNFGCNVRCETARESELSGLTDIDLLAVVSRGSRNHFPSSVCSQNPTASLSQVEKRRARVDGSRFAVRAQFVFLCRPGTPAAQPTPEGVAATRQAHWLQVSVVQMSLTTTPSRTFQDVLWDQEANTSG